MTVDKAAMLASWEQEMASGRTAEKYKKAMQAMQINPMQLAADAVDRGDYVAGCVNGAKRMSEKLRSTPLETLKQNATTEGAQRLGSGARKAKLKYARGVAGVDYDGASSAARAIPKSDPLGRVRASMNALKRSVGKPEV